MSALRAITVPEGTYLSGSINLSLPCILSLTEDRRSHKLVPILLANEVCRLQEDSSPIIPGHSFPFGLGGQRAFDSFGDSRLVSFVVLA